MGVFLIRVTPKTPKTGVGFPAPNGSSCFTASAKSRESAEGFSRQSSLNVGGIKGIPSAYSFIFSLKAAIFSVLRLTPAACLCPPNFVSSEEAYFIASKTAKLKKDKKYLLGNDECEQIRKQTEILSNYITATGPIGEFDKKTFKKTVKRITVSRNKEITFELINGLKLKFEYSEVE